MPALLIAIVLAWLCAASIQLTTFAFSSGDDWPMFHRNPAHTGYTPNAGPTTTPVEIWNYKITSDVEATSPAVAGDYVFVTDQTFTYCLNVSTGAELWHAAGGRGSTPVVYGDYVYTGSGVCTAFNASTGAVVWNLKPGGTASGRVGAVVGGVVYAVGGNAYALNASTGAIIWNYTTGARSAPAFAGGYVYFGTVGTVCALNAYTGAQVWEYEGKAHVESSPAVADGYVYVGVNGIVALNASTGTTIWNYTVGGPSAGYTSSSPAVANGRVFIGFGGDVYAFNASTGTKMWNFPTESNMHSSPAIAGDAVYIGSDNGNLYALNASTGTKLWNYTIQPIHDERGWSRSLYASPAIADGFIYMGSADGDVYALAAASNTTPSPTPSSPTPTPSPTTPEFLSPILGITLASIIIIASFVLICKKWMKKKTQQEQPSK